MPGVLIAATIMLQAASPAVAAAPPQAAAPKANTVSEAVVTGKAKDDPMKVVCKSEIPVGSRLPVKHCQAVGDAEMRKFEDRQMIERMQGDTYRR